jgi:hypothetical protein
VGGFSSSSDPGQGISSPAQRQIVLIVRRGNCFLKAPRRR